MKEGDIVIINEVAYDNPKRYKVVAIQLKPGAQGPVYLVESEDGERLARYANQLLKVE